MRAAAPRVVIADDHEITRLGVRGSLSGAGFAIVGEARDRRSAVELVVAHRPDICLLDISMPGGGIEAAREICERAPGTLIVMLTVSRRVEDVLSAMRAGAVGYLPKDTAPESLPAALAGVLKGEAAVPRTLVGEMMGELRQPAPAPAQPLQVAQAQLSPREAQVLDLMRAGRSTIQIGRVLSLSPITVRRHISAVMAKLGVNDRDEAVRALDPPAA